MFTALVTIVLIVCISNSSLATATENNGIAEATSADGSIIKYGVQGSGDITIVFVHCWTCNHTFWDQQVQHFANKYRVVWLDLAGHGLSGSNRSEYSMASFGADVAAVVNAVGGDKFVLVGHSMGGPVIIETAKILGDKVISLVGVDTFYTPFEWPKSDEKIEEFVAPFKKDYVITTDNMIRSMFTPEVDPAVKESIVKQFAGANQEVGVSAMYGIFRWSAHNNPDTLITFADKLHNINGAPTGDEKPLHESVTLIPHVGHFVAQVKPEEFNRALETIIAEYETTTSHPTASESDLTPAPGNPLRKQVLDALRKELKRMNETDVIFVVEHLRVKGGWAWTKARPQSPDGTSRYEDISALLQLNDGVWQVVEMPCGEPDNPECIEGHDYFKHLTNLYPNIPAAIFPE